MIARLAAALLAGAVAGCASVEPLWTAPGWDVEGVAATPAPAEPLPTALREGYLGLAEAERAVFDWVDAAAFLSKAQTAAGGAAPPPFTLAERTVGDEALRAPLAAAEPQLLALLASPGARLRAPREIAQAQVDWECWIEEAEEGHQLDRIAACRTAFERSLAAARAAARLPDQLVVVLPEEGGEIGGVVLATAGGGALLLDRPFAAGSDGGEVAVLEEEVQEIFGAALGARPPPPRFFTITFDFASSRLDAEAAATVAAVVEEARRRPLPEVVLIGHTDAVGDAGANLRLSRRRALAVREAVAAAAGADEPLRITTTFRGEADPVAPTPAAEPRNRRVEIAVR